MKNNVDNQTGRGQTGRVIDEKDMTLAVDWHGEDVRGWFVSEKIEDCRVMWDGCEFWTRHGNIVPAPRWFKRGLPKCRIDGGIWAGRGKFQQASKAVRLGGNWFSDVPLQFVPFDFPDMAGGWEVRIAEANRAIRRSACGAELRFHRIGGAADWFKVIKAIAPLGGEGVMFRSPEVTRYETGRSRGLLRFKIKDTNYGNEEE